MAAIAGPLADHVFEPAMQPGTPLAQALEPIFSTGAGAGMALQMTLFAGCGLMIALGGYGIQNLRQIETKL